MLQFYLSILETPKEKSEFEKLYKTHRNGMYNIAYKHLKNRNDAEDAVQEAFLRIANKTARIFEIPDDKKKAFLYALVKNIAVDIFNRKISRKDIEYNDELYAESENSIPLDEQILNKLEYEALIEFILQMPDGTKNAMYMKYVAGFTNAEISSALNITENALRQRLFFGRRLIRDYAEAHATNDCT